MKKTILFITLILIVGTLVLAAGFGNRMNSVTPQGNMNHGQTQDLCEDFVDADGDGICDNYGNGLGEGTHLRTRFTKSEIAHNDGECTGVPLNPQDGTGYKYGRNR